MTDSQHAFKYTEYVPLHRAFCSDATAILEMDTFVPDEIDEVDASQLKDDREDIANWQTHVACLVNEEGRLLKLEPNLNLEQFVGTVYMYRSFNNSVTGDAAYASLTLEDEALMGL